MAKGRKKTNSEFFDERLDFYLGHGKTLKEICPEIVEAYNDHSLLKLISVHYWVGIFSPIVHRRIRERFNKDVVYVDTMAGSGVTSSDRAGDFFCGSCPGAVLRASELGFPFDFVHAVEIKKDKAEILKQRLSSITNPSKLQVWDTDIYNVSSDIAKMLKGTVSFSVIDPHGFQGMTWEGISPLLSCWGDAMVTWFEPNAWRHKNAAEADHAAAEGDKKRFDELFGSRNWMKTDSAQELTQLFIDRVIAECGKTNAESVKIPKQGGGHYLMILFTGNPSAEKPAKEWKENLERRINSAQGREISSLLDVKAGRLSSLEQWGVTLEK